MMRMRTYYTVIIMCILHNIISIPIKAEEGIEILSKEQGIDYASIVKNEPKVKIVQIKMRELECQATDPDHTLNLCLEKLKKATPTTLTMNVSDVLV